MDNQKKSKHNEEYAHLESVLNSINLFVKNHNKISYIEFDYFTTHDLTLFYVEPNFDFEELKLTIEKVNNILSSIKRIFSKPIINLKDFPEVLPVETVSKINDKTFSYLGSHFNDIAKIENNRIKPRQLLTQVYYDDYGIYENLVFCHFINELLRYCRKNIKILKELLYANEAMQINLLERINHMDYFLAIGKLHTGYKRDFDKYYDISKVLYRDLIDIQNILKSRLNKPVYTQNKLKNKDIELKKTNIFLMQKDYKKIYVTYKYFITNKLVTKDTNGETDLSKLGINYFYFVEILTIFALGNFGFRMKEKDKINLKRLNVNFYFKDWKINILNVDKKSILITVSKDTEYKVLLLPSISFRPKFHLYTLGRVNKAKETLICSPFINDYSLKNNMYISMENIDSFRRIQQIFLRGMIYSDKKKKTCPFCGSELIYNKKLNTYSCDTCWTEIKQEYCSNRKKKYYYTDITNLRFKKSLSVKKAYSFYNINNTESLMHYRNITKINSVGDPICPFCDELHHK